jgi:hypothetical protein
MSTVASLYRQIASDIDSLADFWRSVAATTVDVAPTPPMPKRARRGKTPPPPPTP